MGAEAWHYVLLTTGGLIAVGLVLMAIVRFARSEYSKLGKKPVRRHKSWIVDAYLDARTRKSAKEIFLGPLPVLLSSLGRALATMTIIVVLGGLVLLLIFVAMRHL